MENLTIYNIDPQIMAAVIGSLSATIFAIVSAPIIGLSERIYKQKRDHYNSLITTELLIQTLITNLKANLIHWQNLKKADLEKNKSLGFLKPLYFNSETFIKLNDTILLNKLLNINIQVELINHDFSAFNVPYTELLKQNLASREVESDNIFLLKVRDLIVAMSDQEQMINSLMNDSIEALAIIKFRIKKDRSIIIKTQQKLAFFKIYQPTHNEISDIVIKIKKELVL